MRLSVWTFVALNVAAHSASAASVMTRPPRELVPRIAVTRVVPLEELGSLPEGWLRELRAPNPNAVFSNVTSTTDKYLQQGPAAGGFTRLLMDDLTFTTASAGGIGELSFSVVNPYESQRTVRLRLRIWNADGPSLGPGLPNRPGSFFTGLSSPPFPLISGLNIVRLWNPGDFLFQLPTTGTQTLWMGLSFSNDGGSTTTDAELPGIGQMLFGPPEVGTSGDVVFETDQAGSFLNVSNPAGAAYSLGAAPLAHLGWELVFGPGPPLP